MSSRGLGSDYSLVDNCPYVCVVWLHVKALQAAACKGKRQKHSPELQDLPVGEHDVITEIINSRFGRCHLYTCVCLYSTQFT